MNTGLSRDLRLHGRLPTYLRVRYWRGTDFIDGYTIDTEDLDAIQPVSMLSEALCEVRMDGKVGHGLVEMVLDRIDGVVTVSDYPPYHQSGIFADADAVGRAKLWNGCLDLIAEVHRIDPYRYRLGFLDLAEFGGAPPQRLANFLRYALNWATGDAPLHPVFVRALDWLDTHLYAPDRVTLCWGDSRMSNVLYKPDFSPVAALDWEIAYLGDPAGDVAWMPMTDWISSPFDGHVPAPGTPGREDTIDRYQRVTGHRLTNMRFAEVTAPLLLAVALIRLNTKLAIAGVDLAEICAQRVEFVLEGDAIR